MRRLVVTLTLLLLTATSGCSNLARFEPAAGQNVNLWIRERAPAQLPADVELASTSFGQYLFQAKSGEHTMYGLLPLRFRGDYLALDILFFAPAMFFNLRTTFDHYEFDPAAGEVRYRDDPEDPWVTYRPNDAEIAHARSYFDTRQPAGASAAAR